MKSLKKMASLAMTGLLAVSALPVVTLAYTSRGASDPKFDQVLNMDSSVTQAPNVTVSYSVEPIENAPSAVTINNVVFTSTDKLTNGTITKEGTMDIKVNDGDNSITKPGLYLYLVTANVTVGADKTTFTGGEERMLKVIVGYETDGNQVPTGNLKVLQANLMTFDGTNKSEGFTVEKGRDKDKVNLRLTKTVKGNQADKDHYFGFKVTFTGTPGTQITMDYTNATSDIKDVSNIDLAPGDKNNATTQNHWVQQLTGTIGDTNVTEVMVYLKHGETVVFKDIPEDVTYRIEEVADDKPEAKYTTTWSVEGTEDGLQKSPTGGDQNSTNNILIGRTDDHVKFVNSLNATVETGVVTTMAPFASIMVIAALGYVAVKATKKED